MSHTHAPQSRSRRNHPPETWADLRAKWEAGGSPAALSRRHGVPLSTLKERAAREGWVRAPIAPPPLHAADADLDDDLPEDAAILARAAWRHAARAVMAGDRLEARAWTRISQDLRATAEADALREQRMADDLTREFASMADEMAADGVEPALLMRDVPPRPGRREPNPLDVALAQAEAVAWAKLHLSVARAGAAPDARPIDKIAAASVLDELEEARAAHAPPPHEIKSARPRDAEAAAPSEPAPSGSAANPAPTPSFPADPADPADFFQRPEPAAAPGPEPSPARSRTPANPALPGAGRGPSLREAQVRRQTPRPIDGPRPSPGRAGENGTSPAQQLPVSHAQPPPEPPARSLGPYWDRLSARPTVGDAERYLLGMGRRLLAMPDPTGAELPALRARFEAKAADLLGPDVLRTAPPPDALCVPSATPTSGPRVALL